MQVFVVAYDADDDGHERSVVDKKKTTVVVMSALHYSTIHCGSL